MKLRLLDAVVIAAIGLLGLKTMDLFGAGSGGPDRADFGRALTHARSGYPVPDPEVTGSVAEAKTNEEKKAAADKAGELRAPTSPMPASPVAGRPVSLDPAGAGLSAAERGLLESLSQRRDELDARQRELDTRESLLATAEKKLDARLGDLKALEGRVSEGERNRPDGAMQMTNTLVTMYETMKPKDAARVFDRLPQEVLVPMVLQMNPRKMAEVLAAMSPETAQKLTAALAGRGKQKHGETRPDRGALPASELPAIDPAAASELR